MRSLRYKIGLGYFVLVMIGLITSALAIYNFAKLGNSVGKITSETNQSALTAENMVKALEEQEHFQLSSMIDEYFQLSKTANEAELYRSYFNDSRDRFLLWYQKSKEAVAFPLQDKVLDSIFVAYKAYLQASDSLFQLVQSKKTQFIAKNYQKYIVRPIAQSLRDQCFHLIEVNQEAMAQTEASIKQTTENAALTIIFTSLASIVLSVFASVKFTRTILQPAEKLTETVRRISQGHLNQKIDITTDDEIGELSQEFNKMTERLREYEELNIHQLIAEKKKSEAVVASMPDPVLMTDEEGHLLLMNQAAKKALEVSGNGWQGTPLQSFVKDQYWLKALSPHDPNQEEAARHELLLSIKQGEAALYFRPRQTKIIDEYGRVQGVVILLQDVTRFKNLDSMKSEFMATVSHEFRTPLTSITMAIDILTQEVLGKVNVRQRDLLVTIKEDGERLTKLVKELLDFSKLESGKYELKREMIDVKYLVEEALKPLAIQFRDKGIEILADVAEGLPSIPGDKQQLSWVITNLVSNAIRYTSPNGKVILKAQCTDNGIKISVADTGRGIPAEVQETIFDKFVQVKQSTDATPGSVGLGLAIAKEVVEAHGGKIWVESAMNEGSVFFFTIPQSKKS